MRVDVKVAVDVKVRVEVIVEDKVNLLGTFLDRLLTPDLDDILGGHRSNDGTAAPGQEIGYEHR